MRFKLKGELVFSKSIEPAIPDLKRFFQGSGDLLKKGTPPGREAEAADLRGWKVDGNKLRVAIESGRYVRAHDAFLRIARSLSQTLGKSHRIGLRGILANSYTIEIPVEKVSEKVEKELKKLSCEVEEGRVLIRLSDLSEGDIRGRMVDRLVSTVEELIESTPVERREEVKVVRSSGTKPHKFTLDPFEIARDSGWIAEFPGRGQWIYLHPYTALLRALEEIIVERVARPLGFEEVMFPKLIPLEVMQRMPGYLDAVPEGMYYVSPPPRDPVSFENFKRELKLTKRVPVEELRKVLKDPAYVLAPAQCEPFYEQFSRQVVSLDNLPIKQFDRSGWTYRWEGGGVEGLVRTQEFHRVELVMLGSPKDVTELRNQVLEKSIEILEELNIEWRVTEATPFYLREGAEEKSPDSAATYDLEVFLPYKKDWLEIGSYNVHQTKFTKSFKIKESKKREIWTGCCGFGTSRWVVGFLAQHGLDLEKWPGPVRKRVKGG